MFGVGSPDICVNKSSGTLVKPVNENVLANKLSDGCLIFLNNSEGTDVKLTHSVKVPLNKPLDGVSILLNNADGISVIPVAANVSWKAYSPGAPEMVLNKFSGIVFKLVQPANVSANI